jgi:hypothetical protein
MPERIQRKRTAGWSSPVDAHGRTPIYVGRPTMYANPFRIVPEGRLWIVRVDPADGVCGRTVGDFASKLQARKVATLEFEAQFHTPGGAEQGAYFASRLHGLDLSCWCELPEPGDIDWCHARVLIDLCNEKETVDA